MVWVDSNGRFDSASRGGAAAFAPAGAADGLSAAAAAAVKAG